MGSWAPLPGLIEFSADFASELGVSEPALLRCRDIVDILDLVGAGDTSRGQGTGQSKLFDS